MCAPFACIKTKSHSSRSIRLQIGQMHREKPACVTRQHHGKEMHIHDKVSFLYLFALVLYVVMDVIKNGNFYPSRLLAVQKGIYATLCYVVSRNCNLGCFRAWGVSLIMTSPAAPWVGSRFCYLQITFGKRAIAIERQQRYQIKGYRNALNSDTPLLNLYCKLTSAMSNTATYVHRMRVVDIRL